MTLHLPSWTCRGLIVAAAIATLTACSKPAEPPPASTTQAAAKQPSAVSPSPAPEGTVAPAASPAVEATPTAQPESSAKPAANAEALAPAAATTPAANATPPPAPAAPVVREITVPAGTALPVELKTTVGSETSQIEDPIRGTIRHAVSVKGIEVIPAGSIVTGHVTDARRSAKVKGLAQVAFRFTSLDLAGDGERLRIQTAGITREAQATKKKDAAKIGGGAAGGAIIGGILGGGSGAAKGAAIGGAAGTGAVLATRGKEVTVPAGTDLSVRLTEPIRLRVRQ